MAKRTKATARPLVKSNEQWLEELEKCTLEVCKQEAAKIFRGVGIREADISGLCRQVPYEQWWRADFTAKCVSLAAAWLLAHPPGKKPVLTEWLSKTELGKFFNCDRSKVKEAVLDLYSHETKGKGNGERYRMPVANMPPAYQQKHLKPK